MTNLFVFWKLVADPPAPWARLTRTNEYVRFATSGHWTQVGALTHLHGISEYSCDGGGLTYPGFTEILNSNALGDHHHPEPLIWYLSSNYNNPPGYGLDIIYMDLSVWEATERRFPLGTIIVSNGSLIDAEVSAFTASDGKYIVHAAPGTLVGTTAPQSHHVTGTLGATHNATQVGSGTGLSEDSNHVHTVDLYSDAQMNQPRTLLTRLYETLVETSKALAGTVVFVDGSVGSNWEILSAWANANLQNGQCDPVLYGSDSHTQAISGNSSDSSGNQVASHDVGPSCMRQVHRHSVSATLSAASHIPLSRQIIPARLKNTLYRSTKCSGAQLIGPLW
jgi:hypothetical protein